MVNGALDSALTPYTAPSPHKLSKWLVLGGRHGKVASEMTLLQTMVLDASGSLFPIPQADHGAFMTQNHEY